MKRLLLLVATLFFWGMALAAVNINTATKEELDALPEIGPVKAQAIIDYRKEHGPFKSIDQIKDVKGIGPATFDKIKGDISLTGATTVPAKAAAKAEPAKAAAPAAAAAHRRHARQGGGACEGCSACRGRSSRARQDGTCEARRGSARRHRRRPMR